MKKRALSIVAYLLCAVMLLTSAVLPVTAEEEKTLDDYLILHYDFEETNGGVLADKATAGNYDDDLLVRYAGSPSGYDGITFNHGIATADVHDGAGLYTAHTNGVSPSTDLNQVYQSEAGGTWFLRFSVGNLKDVGTTETYSTLITMRKFGSDTTRPLMVSISPDAEHYSSFASDKIVYPNANTLGVRVGNYRPNNVLQETTTTYEHYEWYNLAIVYEGRVSGNASAPCRFTTYLIDGEGKAVLIGSNDLPVQTVTGVPLSLFCELNGNGEWQNQDFFGASIDDVRYYTKALTVGEMGGIATELHTAYLQNLDNDLLVHYDFEDNDLGGPLDDKAPADAVNDKLIDRYENDSNNADKKVKLENGTATATATSSGLATAYGTDYYSTSSDLAKIYADPEMGTTWFIRFNAPACTTDSGEIGLMNSRLWDSSTTNNHRLMYTDFNSNNKLNVRVTNGSHPNYFSYQANQWMNLAVVYDGYWNSQTYYSVYLIDGSSATYVGRFGDTVTMGNTNPILPLSLFTEFYAKADQRWRQGTLIDLSIDDFRLYNNKLTTADMVNIVSGFETKAQTENVVSKGIQIANDGNSIRAVAQLKGLDYKSAGFILSMTADNGAIAEEPVAVTYVYDQINADTGVEVAQDGCYLFVLKIELVGADAENAVWTIQPYAMGTDGETMYYGQAFTYTEGADAPVWVTESN